jgi:hypothetical protein
VVLPVGSFLMFSIYFEPFLNASLSSVIPMTRSGGWFCQWGPSLFFIYFEPFLNASLSSVIPDQRGSLLTKVCCEPFTECFYPFVECFGNRETCDCNTPPTKAAPPSPSVGAGTHVHIAPFLHFRPHFM